MSYCKHGSGDKGCVACAIEQATDKILHAIAAEVEANRARIEKLEGFVYGQPDEIMEGNMPDPAPSCDTCYHAGSDRSPVCKSSAGQYKCSDYRPKPAPRSEQRDVWVRCKLDESGLVIPTDEGDNDGWLVMSRENFDAFCDQMDIREDEPNPNGLPLMMSVEIGELKQTIKEQKAALDEAVGFLSRVFEQKTWGYEELAALLRKHGGE